MNNIIYDDPKSSCCVQSQNHCGLKEGMRVNIGVYNHDEDHSCAESNYGFTYLNPQSYQDKVANDFKRSPDCCLQNNGDCNTFTSNDPRLIDVPRALKVSLDRPPMDSTVQLNDIYCDELLIDYGKNYNTYSDVDGGQILYYSDNKFADVFTSPVFSTPSTANADISFNPMGVLEIKYTREPRIKSPQMSGLSWLNDSTLWREDITGLYTAQIREYDWNPKVGHR